MIYLIGGTGCSGKTTLAWRLEKQHHIPFFSLDYLMMGLHHGVPSLDVNPNQPESIVAPKIWQVCKPMLVAMLENGEEYCVEGFAITPNHVDALVELFPEAVRACFLGYCTVDVDEKWQSERLYRGTNTWLLELSYDEAKAELEIMKKESNVLREACYQKGYEFFDTSQDFFEVINEAEQYLITSRTNSR